MNPLAPRMRSDEFPAAASEWPVDLSRRQFLELAGASLALAGLVGCNRQPEKAIVPYVSAPERELLDGTAYYATAMPWEGYARGVLVRSNSGRPTKIEGNPVHPDSLGATDIFMQASVLSLYDPDRSQAPKHRGTASTWQAFESEWLTLHRELTVKRGVGLAVLTEPTTSPTALRAIHTLLDRFPDAHWFQHTPLPRYETEAQQEDYDFAKAEVVLAIDADFLGAHPSALRYARAFASRRRVQNGHVNANRLYVIESAPSTTGSMADHRLPAGPAKLLEILAAFEARLAAEAAPRQALPSKEQAFVERLVADLREKGPNVLCVAGEHLPPEIRSRVAALNAQLGAYGKTIRLLTAVRSDADPRSAGDLAALTRHINSGKIDTLLVVSANPAYTAPRDVPFVLALGSVHRTIHLGSHFDETALLCEWHLPESHYLESWGDLRAFDGTASIVQPLIAPLYATRTAAEFLFFLAEGLTRSDYDLVRETWQKSAHVAGDFDAEWRSWLNEGVVPGTGNKQVDGGAVTSTRENTPATRTRGEATPPTSDSNLTLILRPDPTIRDGCWANNGWLQELPKPISHLVWDNPVNISPALAHQYGLENGDVITLHIDGASVDVATWIVPTVAADCLVAHLGYGRTAAGTVGNDHGFNAYVLRSAARPWTAPIHSISRKKTRASLVAAHAHFSLEGRDLVKIAPVLSDGRPGTPVPASRAAPNGVDALPRAAARESATEPPSLYPEVRYDGYRWAMAIDLGTCIGCQACVAACQAENNTPVVGKEQVARGREMHWLRVDQYYVGDPENPDVVYQPVPCMQCENAPCELVCPTAATVHSSEGLNDMVYNRCIGTRYCSNNCPYKVRRFNFLDFQPPRDSVVNLQKNPDVTVRSRGVMEKCTYCVQRIDAARIAAEKENRGIRDGEVRTACQQACPTEAIVFGDLNDPASRVRARKAEPTHFVLLEELNTRPRTTYLAKITNKHPEAKA